MKERVSADKTLRNQPHNAYFGWSAFRLRAITCEFMSAEHIDRSPDFDASRTRCPRALRPRPPGTRGQYNSDAKQSCNLLYLHQCPVRSSFVEISKPGVRGAIVYRDRPRAGRESLAGMVRFAMRRSVTKKRRQSKMHPERILTARMALRAFSSHGISPHRLVSLFLVQKFPGRSMPQFNFDYAAFFVRLQLQLRITRFSLRSRSDSSLITGITSRQGALLRVNHR